MAKTIKELNEEMKAHLLKAREITTRAEEDGDRGFTEAEAKELRDHMAKATAAKAAIEGLKGDAELKRTLDELGDDIALNAKTDRDGNRQTASGFHLPDKAKNLGEQFAKNQRVQSEMWGVKSLVTGGSDTSGGALLTNDFRGLAV